MIVIAINNYNNHRNKLSDDSVESLPVSLDYTGPVEYHGAAPLLSTRRVMEFQNDVRKRIVNSQLFLETSRI